MRQTEMELIAEIGLDCNQCSAGSIVGAKGSRPDKAASAAVTAHELSELVSGALQDAILAASQRCAATYLNVLEVRKQDTIVAQLKDLPTVQLSHPVVHAEVQTELAMMRAQRKLAAEIVEAMRIYARSKRRAVMAAMS